MRRALAAAALAALVLTGCGTGDTGSPSAGETSAEASSSPSPSGAASSPTSSEDGDSGEDDEADAIEIEIEGDRIEPNGMRVKVGVGEEVRLAVTSDRAASLHVHSSPEQTLEVDRGETLLTLTVDRPGVVDIEEHETGLVVIQLEVR